MGALASSTRARLAATDSPLPLLDELPLELQLRVCEAVGDPHDRAALCLAAPRLGLAALSELPPYKEPLTSVAVALTHRLVAEVLDEASLRRYAAAKHATEEGCAWLAAAAERYGWPLHVGIRKCAHRIQWHLDDGEIEGPLLRAAWPNGVEQFYEGERGAERGVRAVYPSGVEGFFEGEKGAERRVRAVWPDGQEEFYAGEQGTERVVRTVWPDGQEEFFEGERDAERLVRAVSPGGVVHFFEGEKGAERLVRAVLPSGEERFLVLRGR